MEFDGNHRDLIIQWRQPMGENVNLRYTVFSGFAENRQEAETILQEYRDGLRETTFIDYDNGELDV